MTGIEVTVPVACFRKGLAREFFETEVLPPPSTCYGFLLSLVGEADRARHVGVRVCPVLVSADGPSVVLRTVWRVRNKNARAHAEDIPRLRKGKNSPDKNFRPDYQQLLTNVRLVIWLDSGDEAAGGETLERRVRVALTEPRRISRFGGLSLGESTHLVDEVRLAHPGPDVTGKSYLLAKRGRLTLPVWVDHVGAEATRHVSGDLVEGPIRPPPVDRMPAIQPT